MVFIRMHVHPSGLNFANQKKVVMMRDVGKLSWEKISKKVQNLKQKRPPWKTCARAYDKFSAQSGHAEYKYANCGRPAKLTEALKAWLVKRLLYLRRRSVCTSTMLQRELARVHKVKVEASSIRRALLLQGYKWLPRAKKPLYSKEVKAERVAFAEAVLGMTPAQWNKFIALAMDGVVLTMPPKGIVDRENFIRADDRFVWRKPSEKASEELQGHDRYSKQAPLNRCVPLWGGVSANGFAAVLWHDERKVCAEDYAKAVREGALTKAIKSLKPSRSNGPWTIIVDNETFLRSPLSQTAHAACKVSLLKLPPKSPDLNPVEKFWAWLRRRLKALDLEDLVKKRPLLGRTAYRERVKRILRTKKAHEVAANCASGLPKVAREVKRRNGASTRG